MRNPIVPTTHGPSRLLHVFTLAVAAMGFISTARAQVQTAGDLLVNVDATASTAGPLTSIANSGTLAGFFEARAGGTTVPTAANVHGNGTVGISFDVGDYMQLVDAVGGAIIVPPDGIVGANPDFSIEAWVMNPSIQQEESVVAWARRGGPDGGNCSFNYGWDASYGAMGHWGAAADMGWDSTSSTVGAYPPGVPAPGVWHHLVYTFDGTTQKAYVDGVEQNSEAATLNLNTGTSIILGAQLDADGLTPVIFGTLTIARARIHDGALSAAQVNNNYDFERNDFAIGGAPIAAGPIHRYSFSNPAGTAASGSVVTDSLGGANGVVLGAGANFTGTRVSIPGGSSSTAAYVDLPNNMVSTNAVLNGGSGEVTLEGWIKITGAQNWGRIFDFGSSLVGGVAGEVIGPGGGGEGRDYLMWSASIGTDERNQRIEFRNEDPAGGGIGTVDHPTAMSITTRKDTHIAMTWKESENVIRMYENGSEISSLATDDKMSDLHDVNVWLGRSNWTGDNNAQAEYDEFRVYNFALPPEQIQASYQAGPNSLATADPVVIVTQPTNAIVPEAGTATFSVVANGAPPVTYRWFKNSTLAPGATTAAYSFSPVTVNDNNTEVFCIVSNNLFSTAYTATSDVVTLTVVADTTPPAISLARVAAANQIQVIFSEPVNATDAGTPGNYSVTGPEGALNVTGAVVESPTRVLLTLSANMMTCAYYTLSVTGIRDVSAAENVTPAGTTGGAWNFVPSILAHRYPFNDAALPTASGADAVDIIGGANGVIQNASGLVSLTGDKVSLGGGPSATSPYVDLPNNLLSNNSTNRGGTGQFTFEGWFKATGVQNWSRIFDFGSSSGVELPGPGGSGAGSEVFLYAAMIGTDSARHRLERVGTGGVLNDYGVANFGRSFHFVVTWDEATGIIEAFEDGIKTVHMITTAGMDTVNDLNTWLGRSNWTGDNNTQGEYDEFRVYNRVLGTNDIARNLAGGPDFNFGAPLSFDLVIANPNMAPDSTRQTAVKVNFANIGMQDLASSGCVGFESSDPSVVDVTQTGLLMAHTVGTATITARFNGFTSSVDVNVILDETPPTLVRARALGSRYVEVQFSEPLEHESAISVFSYVVTSSADEEIFVREVTQLSDPTRVVIDLESAMPCDNMTLTVYDVTDAVGNPIALGSKTNFMNLAPKGLTHRYTFDDWAGNAPWGTRVREGIGGADGFVLGDGASYTSDRVVLPGGSSGTAAYVDLPNGLLSANSASQGGSGEVSFEGWYKNTGNRNWGRIFDFGSSGGGEVGGPGGGGEGFDYLMLSAQFGSDTATRRTELRNEEPAGGGQFNRDFSTADFNQDTHFVVTWKESTGEIATYANGVQVSSMTVPTQMSEINDVNVWLGRSNWSGDDNAQGEFDEFRVYNKILTTSEMAFNETVGPDINVGLPVAVRLVGPTSIQVGQTLPPVALADFTLIAGVDINQTDCATFESSDPTTVAVTPEGQLQALAPGSANITARFSGLVGSGTVYSIAGNLPATNHVAISVSAGTGVDIRYNGVPGQSYNLLRAPTVLGLWNIIDTKVAPASGIIDFADPTPTVPNSFYRVEGP